MCLIIVFIFLVLFNLCNKLKSYRLDVAASRRLAEGRKSERNGEGKPNSRKGQESARSMEV
jgi:hypothetical protein